MPCPVIGKFLNCRCHLLLLLGYVAVWSRNGTAGHEMAVSISTTPAYDTAGWNSKAPIIPQVMKKDALLSYAHLRASNSFISLLDEAAKDESVVFRLR